MLAVSMLAACDQLLPKDPKAAIQAADKRVSAGDFRGAIKMYEAALDGTPRTAEAHYKLGVLYDDKLRSPLDALHHFSRYLEIAPKGDLAREARAFKKEGELKLATSLSKGTFIAQDEAVRLKNDNLSLRKLLVEARAPKASAPAAATTTKPKGEPVQKPIPPGSRTHTVSQGETLAAIARKYYKNSARWKDIQDANFYALEGTVKIKAGQTLIIP